jgi:predicted metalloprotease with PDZ domain
MHLEGPLQYLVSGIASWAVANGDLQTGMGTMRRAKAALIFAVLLTIFCGPSRAEAPEPIVYTIKMPAPEKHAVEIEAVVPTGNRPAIDVMMAVWSPGFYRVQDHAKQVDMLAARTADGKSLDVEQPEKNHWKVATEGAAKVVLSYRLTCQQISVTTNYVGADLAVFNGAATFPTLVERGPRPHEVRIELPPAWKRSVTALEAAPDRLPNHYQAADFDTLVDSPIVAGNPAVHEFVVDGAKHYLVDIGEFGAWDGAKAAAALEKIVAETHRFWGFLPFKTYYFLNVFRRPAGGLEHRYSTLLTAMAARTSAMPANFRWFGFVSHEYFHAFNVKRLRPVELGPFDYEHPPRTASLWIAEGLTSYFGDLIVVRAGLGTTDDYLGSMSSSINQLQNSPGRLVESLEQASLDVWGSGISGVARDRSKSVSYYVKGPVVGLLLDAKIRRANNDRKSLDDVMRLAYQRYAGERGFTPDQFRAAAEEVAGIDLKDWFKKAISSTEELDYTEALDWFGLRFAPAGETNGKAESDPTKVAVVSKKDEPNSNETPSSKPAPAKQAESSRKWKLEIRPDATVAQAAHLRSLLHTAAAK